MQIETHVDHWGTPQLVIRAESSHESALLEIISKHGVASTGISEGASDASMIGHSSLHIYFYAREKKGPSAFDQTSPDVAALGSH